MSRLILNILNFFVVFQKHLQVKMYNSSYKKNQEMEPYVVKTIDTHMSLLTFYISLYKVCHLKSDGLSACIVII